MARVELAREWNERHAGRILSPDGVPSHYRAALTNPRDVTRLLQLAGYDPGLACYRYHSAFNTVGDGVSAFARYEHTNPRGDLRQWDIEDERANVQELCATADVILCHSDYSALDVLEARPRSDQLVMRVYHGSVARRPELEKEVVRNREDDAAGAVQIGARLYFQAFSARMHWLPIAVPVADYAALVAQHKGTNDGKTFIVGHSPTMRAIKGTTALEFVVQALRNKGVNIALLNIEGKSHADALAMKARCDVFFDSFFLGIQGSGLEAACMGQAVVAGDVIARDEYIAAIGYCPYTFASTPEELGAQLERLAVDAEYRSAEAWRVKQYVMEHHDYPAVGRQFWHIVEHERRVRGLAAA